MLFLSVRGFLDYAGPTVHSRLAWLPCCLPPTRNEVGILIYGLFAAQSPRPPIPLSTLQAAPRGVACKTRGQDGFAGLLSRRALSSPTTCRFIPALSGSPVIRQQSPSKSRDAFAGQYEFGFALEEILLPTSCTGGFPNSRVYSRLNCEELSYPTRRLTVPTSFRSLRRRTRASW